ncbi:MAG: hypothetical protein RhofKO_09370 [Rhodothermales bacterium]
MTRLLLCLVLLLPTLPASAQLRLTLAPSSRMWIEGSSTVSRFTCTATTVQGKGTVPNQIVRPVHDDTSGSVWVEVRAFDCGNGRMNADFYRALKADDAPLIVFTLDDVTGTALQGDTARVEVRGQLALAGTTRQVAFEGQGRRTATGHLHFTGMLPLRMTDFGIKPPTALMGLIRAHDELIVHFDLTAQPVVDQ